MLLALMLLGAADTMLQPSPAAAWVLTPHAAAIVARNSSLLGTCLPCCDEPPPGQPCCCPGGCPGGCPGCPPVPPSCPPPQNRSGDDRQNGPTAATSCLGEFSMCASGACSMSDDCGQCKRGEFLCPSDQRTCVPNAAAYTTCPGLKGTHLDWTLSEEERLEYLVRNTSVEEQAAQMTNSAPALDRLGIPAYQWLNDDQHGVGRTDGMMPGPVKPTVPKATILPNGCGLGATWSKQTLSAAGATLGVEARALHNGFVHLPGGHDSPAAQSCNGCGITLYSPNLNLVRRVCISSFSLFQLLCGTYVLCRPSHNT